MDPSPTHITIGTEVTAILTVWHNHPNNLDKKLYFQKVTTIQKILQDTRLEIPSLIQHL
jgi:hypothetical protein